MEYLARDYDGSDRWYHGLLDLTNAAWPDPPRTVESTRKIGRSINVLRVRRITIRLEARPAR